VQVGVDVGGTKVAVLVVEQAETVLARVSAPTVLASPAATLRGIAATIRDALHRAGAGAADVTAIGLGIPGRVDRTTGVVRQAVNLGWQEVPAGAWLAAELGVPCVLENDARAAAAGLARHPEYSSRGSLAYVGVGTGIGGGLVLDGRLYRGAHDMAGEIGHMIMERDGTRCSCGARGCLETLAAGPAVARQAGEALATGAPSLLQGVAPLTAAVIYEAAAAGDALACSVVETAGRYLGQALQQLVMAYDVDRLYLGGGVSRAGADRSARRPDCRGLSLSNAPAPG